MSTMASQITGVSIVYSAVCSGAHQRIYQSSASLAFVKGIYRWPVDSPYKGSLTRNCFNFMTSSCHFLIQPLELGANIKMLYSNVYDTAYKSLWSNEIKDGMLQYSHVNEYQCFSYKFKFKVTLFHIIHKHTRYITRLKPCWVYWSR